MILHTVGQNLTLRCDENELWDMGLKPSDIDGALALTLFRLALQGRPCDLDGARLEIFCGRHDVLLFARVSDDLPRLYEFENLEELISAAGAVPEFPSSLYLDKDRYILAVCPWEEEGAAVLGEFALRLDVPRSLYAHIREHCRELIRSNALSVLRRTFRS